MVKKGKRTKSESRVCIWLMPFSARITQVFKVLSTSDSTTFHGEIELCTIRKIDSSSATRPCWEFWQFIPTCSVFRFAV